LSKYEQINWDSVRRILVIRLRSIGDTVLATPVLSTLRRELPQAEIDVALEDWVSPLLDGFEGVELVSIGSDAAKRLRAAGRLRKRHYDAVINLHGGSTSSTLAAATLAEYRIGFSHYRFPRTYTHLYDSPAEFWGTDQIHSVEQQLALIGLAGIEVDRSTPTSLPLNAAAEASIEQKLVTDGPIALIHPAAAYETKRWAAEKFARVAKFLREKGFSVVAIAAGNEKWVLDELKAHTNCDLRTFDDLTLPEITALARRSAIFVGNDSGIAHIAAAVQTPAVVIFGSSNRVHWRPWTTAPNEIVFNEFPCQPCPGDKCHAFPEPRCILSISTEQVISAIEHILTSGRLR